MILINKIVILKLLKSRETDLSPRTSLTKQSVILVCHKGPPKSKNDGRVSSEILENVLYLII